MRRLDHTMIFVLIAGSYTPFAVLVLHGPLATMILISMWSAALAGAAFKLICIDAAGWLIEALIHRDRLDRRDRDPGTRGTSRPQRSRGARLGGVLYSVGPVIYARQRPDPLPTVFGYHELFHLSVVVAAGLQYAVVAFRVI